MDGCTVAAGDSGNHKSGSEVRTELRNSLGSIFKTLPRYLLGLGWWAFNALLYAFALIGLLAVAVFYITLGATTVLVNPGNAFSLIFNGIVLAAFGLPVFRVLLKPNPEQNRVAYPIYNRVTSGPLSIWGQIDQRNARQLKNVKR